MMALTPDNRLNSIRCAWDGAANNSTSRLEVNGTTVRRNLALDPGFTKILSFASWKGGNTKGEELLSLSLSSSPSRYGLAA